MSVRRLMLTMVASTLLLASCGGEDKGPHAATPMAMTPVTEQPAGNVPRTPDAAAWAQRAALPTPRAEVASAVLDGRIYVIAGFEASGNSSSVVEVYDAAA